MHDVAVNREDRAHRGPSCAAWRGRLFLSAGVILFIGPGGAADRHAHHAVQLVWASGGDLLVTRDEPLRRRATLVPSNTPHAFDATGRQIALLLVDPNGTRGAALDRRARADAGAEIAPLLAAVRFPSDDLTLAEAEQWCDETLAALGAARSPSPLSSVSRRAIAYVESAIDGMPRLAEAARRVNMSPTRLTHVFSSEVGVPFRRFVLWTRIKRAVDESRRGADLTAAAVAAGFSDSAHLSRTFRAMFGLPPSLVIPLVETFGSTWEARGPA